MNSAHVAPSKLLEVNIYCSQIHHVLQSQFWWCFAFTVFYLPSRSLSVVVSSSIIFSFIFPSYSFLSMLRCFEYKICLSIHWKQNSNDDINIRNPCYRKSKFNQLYIVISISVAESESLAMHPYILSSFF